MASCFSILLFRSLPFFLAFLFPSTVYATDDSTFALYAYGSGIGGASVVYSDSLAYLQNMTVNNTAYSNLYLTPNASSTWVANPNTTTNPNATWSNQALYIPGSGASTNQIGFTSTSTSNVTTTNFFLYGQFVIVNQSGSWETAFYALPSSTDGIYSLLWDAADTEGSIPLSLRTVPPSN